MGAEPVVFIPESLRLHVRFLDTPEQMRIQYIFPVGPVESLYEPGADAVVEPVETTVRLGLGQLSELVDDLAIVPLDATVPH